MKKIFITSTFVLCAMFLIPLNAQGLLDKAKKAAKKLSEPVKVEEPKKSQTQKNVEEVVEQIVELTYTHPSKTENTKIIDGKRYRVGKYYSDDMIGVWDIENRGFGFLDTLGNIAIECKYKQGFTEDPYFNGGITVLTKKDDKDKLYYIVDKTGKEIAMSPNIKEMTQFNDGKALVIETINYKSKIYFVDEKGKPILPNLVFKGFGNINLPRKASEGLTAYYDYDKSLWGYYDERGNIAIPAQYKNALEFTEGVAAVRPEDSNMWIYIDKDGKKAIDGTFYCP